jgi:hypothetical protein
VQNSVDDNMDQNAGRNQDDPLMDVVQTNRDGGNDDKTTAIKFRLGALVEGRAKENGTNVNGRDNLTDDEGDNEGDDDDSLAAVASEDDDDNYSEFVDECGKSRCSTTTNTNYVATPASDRNYSRSALRNETVSPRPRLVSPTYERRGSINSINETTIRPPIEEQYSYGPDGLVFNMNVPWERSLRRQMKASVPPAPAATGFFGGNYPFSSTAPAVPTLRHRGFGASGGNTPKKMILGHSESRDYAIDVGSTSFQSDEVSLGTAASSTVPSRMQIIHRSFLNNNHNALAATYYGNHSVAPNPHTNYDNNYNRNDLSQKYHQNNYNGSAMPNEYSNRQVDRRHDVANHRHQNNVGHDKNVYQLQDSSPCRIGDVVKGCRSADESTVSYLTNHYPHEDAQYTRTGGGNYSVRENNVRTSRGVNSTSPKSSNRSVGRGNGSQRVPATDSPNHYIKFLELDPSQSNATSTVVQPTVHSVANDTSCFCMGYNVFDYVLPPLQAEDTVVTTNNTRGTTKLFNPRPHSRLPPVLEGGGGSKYSGTLDSPTGVVDLSAAANLDMKFLRQPLEDPSTNTPRGSKHYRGVDL